MKIDVRKKSLKFKFLTWKLFWVAAKKSEGHFSSLKSHLNFCHQNGTEPTWSIIMTTTMRSSRDLTPAGNNGGDETIEDDTDSPSTRNRIACKTGHILNNLTSSVWYSYALLYFQKVAGLSPLSAGILFFLSQILMAVTLVVISIGRDKRIWNSFSAYGIRKARHVVGSAGILFAWPFFFTPCLFCEAGSSDFSLGMYYLMPVIFLSICWPLTELSYSSLMKEIRAENDPESSR